MCVQGEQTPVQGFGWGCSGFAAPCTGAGLRAMQSSSFWLCHSAVHFLPCASVYPLKKTGRARPRGSPSSTRAKLGLLHFYDMQALGKMKP